MKLSQRRLAEALGVSVRHIRAVERGRARISESLLVKAAQVLGVGARELRLDGGGRVDLRGIPLVRRIAELDAARTELRVAMSSISTASITSVEGLFRAYAPVAAAAGRVDRLERDVERLLLAAIDRVPEREERVKAELLDLLRP